MATKAKPGGLSILPETGLDQPVKLKHPEKLLDDIQSTVLFAKEKKRPDISYGLLRKFDDLGRLSGTGLAFGLYIHQQTFFPDDENGFKEEVFARLGKSPDSVRHYLKAGAAINDLRERCGPEILSAWLGRPVSDWIALGQAQNEHGEFTPKQLAKLADEPDTVSLRNTIQKVAGNKEAKQPKLMIHLKKNGSLIVWFGDESEEIGYLKAKTELGKKVVERIIRKSGVVED